MRITWLFPIILYLFSCFILRAQDIHWSQINQLQSFQNPSYIGQYNEDIKFTFAAKDQWRSVTKPYQTYFASFDTRLRKFEWLSIGCNVFTDVTGDGSLRTNQFNFISKIESKINSKLSSSFGIDIGFTNKNIDFSYFKFDNQYDGFKYNSTLSSNESYSNTSFNFPTIGIGFLSTYKLKKNHELSMGFSIYNINNPKESFYQIEVSRPIRNVLNLTYNYFNKNHLIISTINVVQQGTYHEILLGTLDNIKINNKKIHHLHTGIAYRYLDALILHFGLSYKKSKLIISYDINTSKLKVASNGRGSLEINLQYLLKKNPLTFPINRTCLDYF